MGIDLQLGMCRKLLGFFALERLVWVFANAHPSARKSTVGSTAEAGRPLHADRFRSKPYQQEIGCEPISSDSGQNARRGVKR